MNRLSTKFIASAPGVTCSSLTTVDPSHLMVLSSIDKDLAWDQLKESDPLWETILQVADEYAYASIICYLFSHSDSEFIDSMIYKAINAFRS